MALFNPNITTETLNKMSTKRHGYAPGYWVYPNRDDFIEARMPVDHHRPPAARPFT